VPGRGECDSPRSIAWRITYEKMSIEKNMPDKAFELGTEE